MAFAAKILADSLSPDGVRLTTFEITFPRIILSEFNTHRMFSRNSASSRAIPVAKMLERVMTDPYIPSSWGKNQKGMSASEEVDAVDAALAEHRWQYALASAVEAAQDLLHLGIHKQLTNRLLEPFMWHTCIVSATEWSNFFHLRNNAQAHPDIQTIARMMQALYEANAPMKLDYGAWHLPLVHDEFGRLGRVVDAPEDVQDYWCKVSVARCARVSYLTHDGKRDIQADLDLHDKLLSSGHLSPFEHVARPATVRDEKLALRKMDGVFPGGGLQLDLWFGNFRGWVQYRKLIPNEADILAVR